MPGDAGAGSEWHVPAQASGIGVGVRARCLDKHMADDGFTGRLLTSAENPDPGSAGSRAILAEAARDALRQGVGFLRRA